MHRRFLASTRPHNAIVDAWLTETLRVVAALPDGASPDATDVERKYIYHLPQCIFNQLYADDSVLRDMYDEMPKVYYCEQHGGNAVHYCEEAYHYKVDPKAVIGPRGRDGYPGEYLDRAPDPEKLMYKGWQPLAEMDFDAYDAWIAQQEVKLQQTQATVPRPIMEQSGHVLPDEPEFMPGSPARLTAKREEEHRETSCTVVVAEFNNPADIARLRSMIPRHCKLSIFSKAPGGCKQYAGLSCEQLPNVGREQGTFLNFVAVNYDQLPDRVHFVPLPLRPGEEDRELVLQEMFLTTQPFVCKGTFLGTDWPESEGRSGPIALPATYEHAVEDGLLTFGTPGGCCPTTTDCGRACGRCTGFPNAIGTCAGFELDAYEQKNGTVHPLVPADERPLGSFVEHHLGLPTSVLEKCVVCWNGVSSTTAASLRHWPRSFYRDLVAATDVDDSSEAVHYLERLAQVVFGALTLPAR